MPLHVYNTSWLDPTPHVYNGTAWVTPTSVRVYNTSWLTVYSGTPAGSVAISDKVASVATTSGTCTAGYRLASTGVASYTATSSGTYATISGEWLTGGAASDYEVRAQKTAGTGTPSNLNTWLGLGTTRTWSLSQSGEGETFVYLTIQIRDATTLTVLDTADVEIRAYVGIA